VYNIKDKLTRPTQSRWLNHNYKNFIIKAKAKDFKQVLKGKPRAMPRPRTSNKSLRTDQGRGQGRGLTSLASTVKQYITDYWLLLSSSITSRQQVRNVPWTSCKRPVYVPWADCVLSISTQCTSILVHGLTAVAAQLLVKENTSEMNRCWRKYSHKQTDLK